MCAANEVIATPALPIDSVLPSLLETLQARTSAVLVASPGAGKTTKVPVALLSAPWLASRRIVMLEPRRLAARAAAGYMAACLGEKVGETVGYRVRLDSQVGPATRIEVVTEGVLTRMLQADPSLDGVGIVIFDEFHGRSLHADLGLALCLQAQAVLREDLRILAMSATLDAEPVAALLGDAPAISCPGQSFPVETHYLAQRRQGPVEEAVARAVRHALAHHDGDILVFLPGAAEIRRVQEQLQAEALPARVNIAPLYGNLPQEAQDQVLAPSPPGERRVVLATSIAETSLTVPGIRVVIDSGLSRVQRFSPATGMSRLETVPVSQAAADQRRGRAGRLGPGICYRLWTEHDQRGLPAHPTPEILEADLAALALELAAWGVSDPGELRWLDPPPAAAFAQARELLAQLGALTKEGRVTSHGKKMLELGLHPRLAHMVLQALPLGCGMLACELASLLSERDILRRAGGGGDVDLRLRLQALRRVEKEREAFAVAGCVVDVPTCRRVLAEAHRLARLLHVPLNHRGDDDCTGLLLAFAYPDRIAQRREPGRFLLRNGRGAAIRDPQLLSDAACLVVAEIDDRGAESRILLAAPIDLADLVRHFAEQIRVESLVSWDRAAQAVRARQRKTLGAITLQEAPLANPDPVAVEQALLQGIAEEGLGILPWTRTARQLQQRLIFMHTIEPGWPDASDDALLDSLAEVLGQYIVGMKSRADLQQLDLHGILLGLLSWDQRRQLDAYAPTHLQVPSGSRVAIDYSNPQAPAVAVRLQEVFGLVETPRIAGGRVPLTMHLLSPAQRPVQVTTGLASFWREAYFDVRKELRGRYTKHYWPDDPLSATPTRRTKPPGA